MKTTLHDNKYYKIEIDVDKNYMVLKPIGFWRSPEVVPNYLKDISNTVKFKLNLKFSIILDITDMLTHPKEVQEKVHLKGMGLMSELHPLIALTVLPKDDISAMQAKFMARTMGTEIKGFETVEEAEAYLERFKKEKGL